MRMLVVAALMLGCGCGSDGATCESTSALLCSRACECGAPMCRFSDGTGASFEFDSEGDCVALLRLGCSGASGIDFAKCEADAEAASCVGSGTDAGFSSPASCDEAP